MRFLFSLLIILLTFVYYGQKFVNGRVQFEGLPLVGVKIENETNGQKVLSQQDGNFTIQVTENSDNMLVFNLNGFQKKRIQVLASTINKALIIELQEDVLMLENVIVSATRSEIKTYLSPIVVNRISNKTFEATQSLTLSEGLRFSPGLRLENNCQNCGFTQIRMNGMEGPYTQILINSRPVFSALAGIYGLEMLPASMIDRVEIMRGGGSSLYGGNAIAGTINILTKEPMENSAEIGLNSALTAFKTPDLSLTVNASAVDSARRKGINMYGFQRNRKEWDANNDGFSEMTQLANTTFGFDAFFKIKTHSKLKINSWNFTEFRRGGSDFDKEPHQSAIAEQLQHRVNGLSLNFENSSADYKHKTAIYLSGQTVGRASYYGGGGKILSENDTIDPTQLSAINAYGKSRDYSGILGIQYVFEPHEKFNLVCGNEFGINQVADEMPGYSRSINQRVMQNGTFFQLQYKPLKWWTLLAGGRMDFVFLNGQYNFQTTSFMNEKMLPVFVPRLTSMIALNEQLKWRVSFAQGYRAPQAFDEDLHVETVGGAARFIQLAPDLVPERSNSWASSLNYTAFHKSWQFNFVLDGFYTRLNKQFMTTNAEQLPNGISVLTKRNGDGSHVLGGNLESNIALGGKLIFQSGITLQQAIYQNNEIIWQPSDSSSSLSLVSTKNVLKTPNFYGYYTLTFNPTKHWTINYNSNLTGKMQVLHVIDPQTEFPAIKTTPFFWEHHVKVSYSYFLKKQNRLDISIGIYNLGNSFQRDFDFGALRDAGYVYGPVRPRTIYFSVKWRFCD
ncbi:MAG: hypothetical protein RL264_3009 [Bacteroidota bacterium]|jgi:outer membrane receptor for ferrienterochelin and colicins